MGLSTFTVMAGLGGSMGYAMGGLDWGALGSLFGGHVRSVGTVELSGSYFTLQTGVHTGSVHLHRLRGGNRHLLQRDPAGCADQPGGQAKGRVWVGGNSGTVHHGIFLCNSLLHTGSTDLRARRRSQPTCSVLVRLASARRVLAWWRQGRNRSVVQYMYFVSE